MKPRTLLVGIGLFFGSAVIALAYQPYILDGVRARVPEPETSKIYYGGLKGIEHTYFFTAEKSFALYVSLLVPKAPGSRTDFTLEIRRSEYPGGPAQVVATLSGANFNWTEYFETFVRDLHFKGPEYRADAPSGFYEIVVRNSDLQGKYALAIGEEESFPIFEVARLLVVLPRLKKEFFDTSPLYGLMNIVGFGVLTFLLACTAGAITLRRAIIRYARKRREPSIPELLGQPPESAP